MVWLVLPMIQIDLLSGTNDVFIVTNDLVSASNDMTSVTMIWSVLLTVW